MNPNTIPPPDPKGCGSGRYVIEYCDEVVNADTGKGYAADALRHLGKQLGTVMDPERAFLIRQVQEEIQHDLVLDCRDSIVTAHKVILYPQAYRLVDLWQYKSEVEGITVLKFPHQLDRPWMITRFRDFLYTREYNDTRAWLKPGSFQSGEELEEVKIAPENDAEWEPGQLFLHIHMYLFAQRYKVDTLSRYAIKMFHKRACLPRTMMQYRVSGTRYMEMADLVYSNTHEDIMARTLCHLIAGDVHTREKGLEQLAEPFKKHEGMWRDFLEHEHKMLQNVFKGRGDLSGPVLTKSQTAWQLEYLRKISEKHSAETSGPMGRVKDATGSRSASGPAGL